MAQTPGCALGRLGETSGGGLIGTTPLLVQRDNSPANIEIDGLLLPRREVRDGGLRTPAETADLDLSQARFEQFVDSYADVHAADYSFSDS